ncbi:MAG: sigma 54-interacting transcriptional regulator [Deltaproteobacteria bacterium]|nr:sigma 54-interacting transcriptional regulator [Deltaproteobacteria bacterium]
MAQKPSDDELEQRVNSFDNEIEDCKELEDGLKESEERYRSLIEASPSAIMVIQDGNIIFTNPAGAELFGFYDPEEMVGLSAIDLISQESQQLVVERLKNLELGKRNPTAEIALVRQDGSKIIAESTSVTSLLQGKSVGIIIAKDITERKQAEEAQEERLRFQELVSRISTKFIGLIGVEFEQAIQEALAAIGRYFDVDSVRFYRLSLQGDIIEMRNVWRSEHLISEKETTEMYKMKYPHLAAHYSQGEPIVYGCPDECPPLPDLIEILKYAKIKAGVGVPLEIDDSGVDVFALARIQSEHEWPKDIIEYCKSIGQIMLSAMRRREIEIELQNRHDEIKLLKDRLAQENIYLRQEIVVQFRHDEIIGDSDAMKGVLKLAKMVAKQDTSVLILGETGTGKELIARAIHNISQRKDRAMIKVNCAALPATLIESELFGREKGAFTGALSRQVGRFEAADGSTIFLDEIGDMPLEMQAKLLRVLQDGQFERLGSAESVTADVRLIAATNHNLEQEMRAGRFRQDLYYRLSVFPITVPPLRERRGDIPLLVWSFVREFGESMGKSIIEISKKAMDTLKSYSWPGNVRELKNIVERAMILSTGTTLHLDQMGFEDAEATQSTTLKRVEKNHILEILEDTGWKISGRNGAAEVLGLKESTLRARLKKLGIQRKK